ncbi:M48 family metalloprotease [Nonomuraea jabiensis]|uniref:M48 family metalloprotease n=1 Tax=Nonomuraea jabiensis TaxID=882448 RepID=UPI0034229199
MIAWLVAAGVALLPVALGDRAARRLAGAAWTHRCPRAALALWQAIGLGAGLGAVGLGLVAAVAPLAAVFPHGAHTLASQIVSGYGLEGLGPVQLPALAWSASLMSWLLIHTVRTATRTIRERRRQRLLVDVVADHSPAHDAYVLPVAEHVAYCVPGRHRRIVLSRGTLELLTPQELQAVLGHERAHGTLPLARALVRMAASASGPGPASFALADAGVVERLQRLLSERRPPRWVPAAAYSTAGLLLSGPMAVLIAPLICVTF